MCFYIFVVVWFDFEVTTQSREDANKEIGPLSRPTVNEGGRVDVPYIAVVGFASMPLGFVVACIVGSSVAGIVGFGVVGVVGKRFDYLVDCCVFVLSVLAPSFFFLLVVWLERAGLRL